jgi:hypothetical protein
MKKHTLALCLFLSLLAAVPTVAANLFSGSIWGLLTPKGVADLKTTPSGQQVLHVVIHHAVTPYYQIQLTHDVAAALPAGAVISYHFLARSPTKNTIHAVIEKRMTPYTRVLDHTITLTPSWKEYTFTAHVPAAYGSRGLAARLQIGQQAGVVEFKSISLTKE